MERSMANPSMCNSRSQGYENSHQCLSLFLTVKNYNPRRSTKKAGGVGAVILVEQHVRGVWNGGGKLGSYSLQTCSPLWECVQLFGGRLEGPGQLSRPSNNAVAVSSLLQFLRGRG